MRRVISAVLFAVALPALAACAPDDVTRNAYDGLSTRERLQPAPGADRKQIPTYDDYQRSRARDAVDG